MTVSMQEYAVQLKLSRSTKKVSYIAQKRLYILGLILADALMLAAAFFLAYYLRFVANIPIFYMGVDSRLSFYVVVSAILIPAWQIIFWLYRLYDDGILLGGLEEYIHLFNACVSGAIVLAIAQFFIEDIYFARGWVGLTWILTFLTTLFGRFLYRRLGYHLRRIGYLTQPALIVGVNGEGFLLGEQLVRWPTSGLNIIGFLDDEHPRGERIIGSLYILDKVIELDRYIKEYGIKELVLTTSALSRDDVFEIFKKYGASPDIQLRMSSGLFDLLNTGVKVKEMGYVPLISVNRVRLNSVETLIKRIMDIALSLGVLVIGSPIFLLFAILVKTSSPGPMIHRRRVMGLNGTQFDAYKFRTMFVNGEEILARHPDAAKELHENRKIKRDPRITKIGHFLRKSSLDELPQFVNILRGQMSLVGPRMISPPELEEYGQWGMNLLTVRPGLTGLWQVSGRSDVNYEERVRLDMMYIRNYSVWLDLQLVLRTIPVVLLGKGAY